ncbi:uncharacterized protein KGF55_003478 [Candida pseudojiufengensis]|uniref:uncharacterized protein n=1 Tax=Candida pseudojiufengensis TaxID=497109 RepID=UPI002224C7BB|nr:uncharacterized protein KGF55_003478 [Candida pseudojiufengensis]KAI5962402.1 hypothetical protein KGF55_003478 [Candida pseudojiufengensis]
MTTLTLPKTLNLIHDNYRYSTNTLPPELSPQISSFNHANSTESKFHTINSIQQKRISSTINGLSVLSKRDKKTKFHDYGTVILEVINVYFMPDSPPLDAQLDELEQMCRNECFSLDQNDKRKLNLIKPRKDKVLPKIEELNEEQLFSIEEEDEAAEEEDDEEMKKGSRKSSRTNSFIGGLNKKYNSMFNLNSNLNSKLDLTFEKNSKILNYQDFYEDEDNDGYDANYKSDKFDKEFENQFLLPNLNSKSKNRQRKVSKFHKMKSFTQKLRNEDSFRSNRFSAIFQNASDYDENENEIEEQQDYKLNNSSIKSDSELISNNSYKQRNGLQNHKRRVKIQEQHNEYILPTPTLFGFYLLTPILIMYYVGLDTDKKFNLPGFWPDPKTLNQIPKEPHEIQAEVARIKKNRIDKRNRLEAKARELGLLEDEDEEKK